MHFIKQAKSIRFIAQIIRIISVYYQQYFYRFVGIVVYYPGYNKDVLLFDELLYLD